MTFAYALYGLDIASELALPELLALPASSKVDVRVRSSGLADEEWGDEDMHPVAGGASFTVGGVARYVVRAGRSIDVLPVPGAPEENIRLYLLGSAMGMVLHQRAILPLHANAIDIAGRAHLFMGPPGAGKSTLAAYMEHAGRPVLADDVSAVAISPDGQARVSPGLPRLRLWREALAALGLRAEDHARSYAGDEQYDKFDKPLHRAAPRPLALGGVFLLADGDELSFERLSGADAMERLVANIYRGSWAGLAGSLEKHWQTCLQIASTSPVYRLTRPRDLSRLPAITLHIVGFCDALAFQEEFAWREARA